MNPARLNKFLNDVIRAAKDELDRKVEVAQEIIKKEAENVFSLPGEKVIIKEKAPAFVLSIISQDPDFLKKEFGSDEYHPANRSLLLLNHLTNILK